MCMHGHVHELTCDHVCPHTNPYVHAPIFYVCIHGFPCWCAHVLSHFHVYMHISMHVTICFHVHLPIYMYMFLRGSLCVFMHVCPGVFTCMPSVSVYLPMLIVHRHACCHVRLQVSCFHGSTSMCVSTYVCPCIFPCMCPWLTLTFPPMVPLCQPEGPACPFPFPQGPAPSCPFTSF